jgi:hypothetical protein
MLVESEEELTVAQQTTFLAGLAHSSRFAVPVKACLLAAAELAGDEDEVLLELLHEYLEWRRRAQRAADGQPDGPDLRPAGG